MFRRKQPEAEEAPHPKRRFTDPVEEMETVIGAETRLKGTLRADSNVEVLGTIQGNCKIDGLLWVRQGGTVKGDIAASSVVVEGEVNGNVIAVQGVELRAGSTLRGDIEANRVAIAEGSFFEGQVNMRSPDDTQPIQFAEKRKPAGGRSGKSKEKGQGNG